MSIGRAAGAERAERMVGWIGVVVVCAVLVVCGLTVKRAVGVGLESGRAFDESTNLLRSGRAEAAEAGFRRVVVSQPDNPYAAYYLYCSMFLQGEVKEALPELQTAAWLDISPVYLFEPQCQEGKVLTSGLGFTAHDTLLVRRADPRRAYVDGAPPPGRELPASMAPRSVVCWNHAAGLEALALRQAERFDLGDPASTCTP